MLSYIGKNVIKGTRAQDEYMLDWSHVTFREADATGKQHAGATYKNQATKNNRIQEDRTKAITCTTGCKGAGQRPHMQAGCTELRCFRRLAGKVEMDKHGKLVVASYCPAHFDQHLKSLQAHADRIA